MFRYAGIGSRKTPEHIQKWMVSIGQELGAAGWILRSGYADGADRAFFNGAASVGGGVENFIPWSGFNGAPRIDPRFIVPYFDDCLMGLAKRFHPYWDKCSQGAKKLHARNVCQILGRELDSPVNIVVCWTEGGKRGGGTGQALRIADAWKIPIFDLALPEAFDEMANFVKSKTP